MKLGILSKWRQRPDEAEAATPAEPGGTPAAPPPTAAHPGTAPATGQIPAYSLTPQGTVGAEAVTWAMRLFIGREPANEGELAFHGQHVSLENLRIAFAESAEFAGFYGRVRGRKQGFGVPLFLMRPPAEAGLPFAFTPPVFGQPVSQLCTASQFAEPAYVEIRQALRLSAALNRRNWEQAYIVAALAQAGMIEPGRRIIGFGVGRERLPALFASRGMTVWADLPAARDLRVAEQERLAKRIELFLPEIVERELFEAQLSLDSYDMREARPDHARSFDALWGCGTLSRMGSLREALAAVEASLAVLRPGGVAVHTLDFNLTSDQETLDTPGQVLFRRCDIEGLMARLISAGHRVETLNLHPGLADEDAVVENSLQSNMQLKVAHQHLVATSLGLVVHKAG